jgi:hypothetical protein
MYQRGVDEISGATVRLDLYSGDNMMGVATGFMYRRNEETYLVTNWHVMTGRNSSRPQEARDGNFATSAEVFFLKKVGDNLVDTRQCVSQRVDLNDTNGVGLGWYHHPLLKNLCDLAIMPLVPPMDAAFLHLNDARFIDRFILHVSDGVFVLGFPWGLGGSSDFLPVWKSGSVASIPGLDYDGKPRFLIDCRTHKGMSGGPVICHHTLSLTTNRIHNHIRETDPIAGMIRYFCGVYSGRAILRQTDNDIETDLGYVWRAELIDIIIDAHAKGSVLDWHS